ncbi:AlpA family phage regulatory protein [Acinetobacter variabilis]|uniref:helix-turn-helix transcriptional regulator n=1 Tax=Acinetobacter variabilis TaxID=70346 RepID=UPI0030FB37E0
MQTQLFVDVKFLSSAPATPEKTHRYKTGKNVGKIRKLSAKPSRRGLLPVSEKTIWTWVREGKFPSPIRLNGRTVWLLSTVNDWINSQAKEAE